MLTTLAMSAGALYAVVACGPVNGGKVYFINHPKGKERLTNSCLTQFSGRSSVRVDSDKMTVEGKSIQAKICQADPRGDDTTYTLPRVPGAVRAVEYKPTVQRISYQVEKIDKTLRVGLVIGVDFGIGAGLTPDDSKAYIKWMDDLCLKPFRAAWRSSAQRNLELDITIGVADDFGREFDQILTLKSSPPESGKKPRFIATLWPDRGQFIPVPQFDATCASLDCKRATRATMNLPFCANLAVVIGQWLGLKSPQAESATCQAPALTPTVGQKALGFMVSADPSAPDFWSKARFSRADITKILEPACKGKLKPDAKPPENSVEQ